MEITLKIEKTFEVKWLQVHAEVRYWEDADVNGIEDTTGKLIPFKNKSVWEPKIDIDSGTIVNWPVGTTAKIHYKVCDAGTYDLLDSEGNIVCQQDNCYVLNCLSPGGKGYGDYIIMNVDESGKIENWRFDPEDFINDED